MKKTYEKPEMEWIEFDETEMIICKSDNESPWTDDGNSINTSVDS